MAATSGQDDQQQLLRLAKPTSFDGKEESWTEWSFVMRSYLAIQSNEISILTEAAEDAASPDISMDAIRERMGSEGITATKKLFHLLVMSVKGPALAVLRGNREMNGTAAWRSLTRRYEPNTAPRVQSLMSAILNSPQFPSDLSSYENKLGEWEENIYKWESISGDTFNGSMKKALYVDKAPQAVKTLLQMQNLDDYAAMKSVTLQFLQSTAEYRAGVPIPHHQQHR